MQLRSIFVVFALLLPTPALAFTDVLSQLREGNLQVRTVKTSIDGIPRGADRVKLLSLDFQASCGSDVTVNYLKVHMVGKGNVQDIDGIYALKGFRRLSRSVKFSSGDNTAVLRLRGFRVPACKRERLHIAVDFARTADVGGQFILGLESAHDIATSANVLEAQFPLRSHFQAAASRVTPQNQGMLTVTFLPISNVRAVQDEVIAKMRIEADMHSHHLLRAITLKNTGTAKNDDIRNIYMTRGTRGRSLTPVVREMDDDTVTLRLSRAYLIKRNQKLVFQVRGTPYTTRKTIALTLEESSDVHAEATRRYSRGDIAK